MKIKKQLLLALSTVFAATTMRATPTLPSQVTVHKPALLLQYTVKESELNVITSGKRKYNWGQNTATSNLRYWEVWSDRSHNTTYEEPKTNAATCGELNFEEAVRIAQIENGFALVYQEQQRGTDYPAVSRSAVSKGWIPMENLLLWSDCPTNDFRIYNKALIMSNIDEHVSSQAIGNLFKNPVTNDGVEKLQPSMQFFFVMKREGDMVLLSKESHVGGNLKALYGWVHKSMFTPWSQRTCLEPNWDNQVVSQLKGTPDGTVHVFSKRGVEATTIQIGRQKYNIDNTEINAYRLPPSMLRYPLLATEERKSRYLITTFASIGGEATAPTMDQLANAQEVFEHRVAAKNNVNLILVIDGTEGMAKYYPYAKAAIRQACSADNLGNGGNRRVRVGVVIYRDYANGNHVTETLPLCDPTSQRLDNFLTTGGTYGIKSAPSDRTDFEALYKGLEAALDTRALGYSKEESNLMLVIGDCGNDPADNQCKSQEWIINKLAENYIQLSSFQVRKVQSTAYNLFRRQMMEIVSKNMEKQYKDLSGDIREKYKPYEDGFDYDYDVQQNENFFIGGFRNPLGEEMNERKLYELVRGIALRFNTAMSNQQRVFSNAEVIMNNEPTSDQAYTQVSQAFLERTVGRNVIEQLRNSKLLTAFEGYVAQKSPQQLDYWKPIIYISHNELLTLLEALKPVVEAANNNPDDRKPYVDAMKSVVRSMLPDVTEERMNQMDNREIMEQIMGLNVRTNMLQSYSLIDIQSEQKVPKAEFDRIIHDFIEQYTKLERINSSYAYSVKRAGVRWYWIPAEDVP